MHCCSGHNKDKHKKESKNLSQEFFTQNSPQEAKGSASKWLYLSGAGLIVAVIAVTIFKIPPVNLLFYGVLLACPLAHVFLMKKHGSHGAHPEEKKGA